MSLRRRVMSAALGALSDPDIRLVAEGTFIAPEQTSAKQTVFCACGVPTSEVVSYLPFLAVLEYIGTIPSECEKRSLIKSWTLFAPHSNTFNFTTIYGNWASILNTDGSTSYKTLTYGDTHTISNMITITRIADTGKVYMTLSAESTAGTYLPGEWRLKLYRLSE